MSNLNSPTAAESSRRGNARWAAITVAAALAVALLPIGFVLMQANNRPVETVNQYIPPTPAATSAPPAGARPVVIDTDMGLDDWTAILYLLQSSDFRVEAITVAGTGEAHCAPGVRNVRGLLALAGYPQIPVACGAQTPIANGHSFPDEWRHGADTMMGMTLPSFADPHTTASAPELLRAAAAQNPGKLNLLTLGPLTNVAQALQNDPLLATRLQAVYIMGGAVDVPGNVSVPSQDKSYAEWNIYADPGAADIVFSVGLPITLVPLDATNKVPLTGAFIDRLAQKHSTPEADFASHLLESNRAMVTHDYSWWDTFTAAVLADNSLATFRTMKLRVVQNGAEVGRTIADTGDKEIRVAVSADASRFEQTFLDMLNAGGK